MEEYTILVSAIAAEHVKKQLIKRGTPDSSLRLGVKGSGCSGFSYVLQYEDAEPKERDLIFQINDLRVIVDKKSIIYLNGCTLDWERTLLRSGYIFINPNEKKKCGCGLSFEII